MKQILTKTLLFTVLLGMAVVAKAQQLPIADASLNIGYVVDLRGDTLRGQLTVPRFVSEFGVVLRPADGSAAHTFLPRDCQAFGYPTGPRYTTQRIRVAMVKSNTARDSSLVFMQTLVQGQASLYRLDYKLSQQGGIEYSRYENVFYWIQQRKTAPLQLLSEGTYQNTLTPLVRTCSQVSALLHQTRFLEKDLAQLFLTYNRACGPATAILDLRPSEAGRPRLRVRFGVSLGYLLGQIYYPNTALLTAKNMKPQGVLKAGLLMTVNRPGHRVGLQSGLVLATWRSNYTISQAVPTGYSNTGQLLDRVQRLQTTLLQVPALATIRLGHTNWAPCVIVGPSIGIAFNDKSTLETDRETYHAGEFYPRLEVYQSPLSGSTSQFGLCLGAVVGIGVQPEFGKRQFIGRMQYEVGRQSGNDSSLGSLQFNGFSAEVGILF